MNHEYALRVSLSGSPGVRGNAAVESISTDECTTYTLYGEGPILQNAQDEVMLKLVQHASHILAKMASNADPSLDYLTEAELLVKRYSSFVK